VKKVLGSLKVKLSRAILTTYANSRINQSTRNSESKPAIEFSDFSISISTFENRFEAFALPLIREIRKYCGNPITIVINGNFQRPINHSTLQNFLSNLIELENVYPVIYNQFQGWASLVNTGIRHSASSVTYIFNDDIYLDGRFFKEGMSVNAKRVSELGIGLLNGSWSHFGITRECVYKVGLFDERFLGIGEEDADYQKRYKSFFRKGIENLDMPGMINLVHDSRDNGIAKGKGKYSMFNKIFAEIKSEYKVESFSQSQILQWRTRLNHLLGEQQEKVIRNEILAILREMKKIE
jgi:hypothetical protein